MERPRQCVRPTCSAPATASLTYQYASRTAWLDDLTDDREPTAYDLCSAHADGLRVPLGWAREDRRSSVRPLFHVPLAG